MSEFAQDFHVDLTLKYHNISNFMYIEPMAGNRGGNSPKAKWKFSLMLIICLVDPVPFLWCFSLSLSLGVNRPLAIIACVRMLETTKKV